MLNAQDDKLQYVNKLQPKYSSVDLTEVELPETETGNSGNGNLERGDENAHMLLDVRMLFALHLVVLLVYTLLSSAYFIQSSVFCVFFSVFMHFFPFPLHICMCNVC